MIVNSRKDLDALSQEERDRFIQRVAGGVQRWRWIDGAYQLVEDTSGLERLGLTLSDVVLPDPPPKPAKTPDEKEREERIAEIEEELERIDQHHHTDRGVRQHMIEHPSEYAAEAVSRAQAAEDEAQILRDELATL